MKITNENVILLAKKMGFDLVGFAKADELKEEISNLLEWLQRGYQAGMSYMEKNLDKREDVKKILPEAKSVISLGLNYYPEGNFSDNNSSGKVSRYAWGKDYHFVLWNKLDKLIFELKQIDNSFVAKSYVDTGPFMDKAWAVKSGLGWLGKHTNVINKRIGSWFFISNIITNYVFEYSSPQTDLCGSCTKCLDACPTNAIVDEYVINSNKCISYLTIENKGEIGEEYKEQFNNWIFGCDICQDVCPWNIKFSKFTCEEEFINTAENKELKFDDVLEMNESEFKDRFKFSPIKRTKLSGLKRNARMLE